MKPQSHEGSEFAPSRHVEAADESVRAAIAAGVIMQRAEGGGYDGRHLEIEGTKLLNFGSCSYLGLELRPELRKGVTDAVDAYGTQFSFSRAFLDSPLYAELEQSLARITGGHVLVTPTTTLGHIASMPVLVEPGDAVIVDQFAHASLHTATGLLRGVPIEIVRHNRLDLLARKIEKLAQTHRRVWYVLDGLYSMVGDFAPLKELNALLEAHPQLHLYVDDAHATSWVGKHGRGCALDMLVDTSRVVVALSLNKAFSASGGVLVFPTAALRDKVRRCGGPLIFSGPVQPPMLGAAVASARLHLAPEFALLQEALADRIRLVIRTADEHGVVLAARHESPIFFVRCGSSEDTFAAVKGLRARGIYTCASVFPAVPQNMGGMRFTVSIHNTTDDIRTLIAAIAEERGLRGTSGAAAAE